MFDSKLERMRKACNRHAEKAGLGQIELNAEVFLWWLTHHICCEIQVRKKLNIKVARVEDVVPAFADRWGLPLVPWEYHPFSMSICKLDHGIPMRIGLKERDDGRPFDPVLDIDLETTTLTVDTWFTNVTMFNWDADLFNFIRELVCLVPDTHPYWVLDKDRDLEV